MLKYRKRPTEVFSGDPEKVRILLDAVTNR